MSIDNETDFFRALFQVPGAADAAARNLELDHEHTCDKCGRTDGILTPSQSVLLQWDIRFDDFGNIVGFRCGCDEVMWQ